MTLKPAKHLIHPRHLPTSRHVRSRVHRCASHPGAASGHLPARHQVRSRVRRCASLRRAVSGFPQTRSLVCRCASLPGAPSSFLKASVLAAHSGPRLEDPFQGVMLPCENPCQSLKFLFPRSRYPQVVGCGLLDRSAPEEALAALSHPKHLRPNSAARDHTARSSRGDREPAIRSQRGDREPILCSQPGDHEPPP